MEFELEYQLNEFREIQEQYFDEKGKCYSRHILSVDIAEKMLNLINGLSEHVSKLEPGIKQESTNCLFDVNTILQTKDGRVIGNAIIIGKDQVYNIIKTDYGNEARLTDNEIKDRFYIIHPYLIDEEVSYFSHHKYFVK